MTREENIREARSTIGLLQARLDRLDEMTLRVEKRKQAAVSQAEIELTEFIGTLVDEAKYVVRANLDRMADVLAELRVSK